MNARPPRSFYDGPTIRVALHLQTAATDNVAHLDDRQTADDTNVTVKDLRQILRRLEAAGMLTRSLLGPGRRAVAEPRTIRLHPDAPAWRGVKAWVDLYAAEDFVQHQLGVAPGRPA